MLPNTTRKGIGYHGGEALLPQSLEVLMNNLPDQDNQRFSELISEIEQAYIALGHNLGWRFLSVPRTTLDTQTDIALITLNPGGDRISPEHPSESCENGVSYIVETWGTSLPGQNKLQVQVQRLFEALNKRMALANSTHLLMQHSLIGYFVPFRSPRFADLPKRAESLAFGRELWRKILATTTPRLIICIDRATHKELQLIIPSTIGVTQHTSRALPTGWGNYTADLTTFAGVRPIHLLRLPHLSTFQLFSSEKCKGSVSRILDEACDGL